VPILNLHLYFDCRDPETNKVFADFLSWDKRFVNYLNATLTDQGIIAMQLGKAPNSIHSSKKVDEILSLLEGISMESLHRYENVSDLFNILYSVS